VIRVVVDDLASVVADAVVRPTNGNLEAITPALRRFELAAGPRFRDLCHVQHELAVGAAVVTAAGDLPAELVVHAVIMARGEGVTGTGVQRAITAVLRQAEQWQIGTLALPPLGTGAGQLSPEEAADALLAALEEHQPAAAHPANVLIVVGSDVEREVFEARLARGSLS
jgi:O-acetyl-ADP-ribose deacetylase (regulator of RNase III)